MFHNDSNIKKGKKSLCRRLYSFIQLYDASLRLSSFAAFEPPSKKCQATSFSSKYKLDIAWSQATVFCQVKMTLNSHFSVFFVMFTQSLRALKRPFVSSRSISLLKELRKFSGSYLGLKALCPLFRCLL